MRFFVVGLIAIFITSPALSDDNIKISCIEMAKLDGGGNMCDVSSEFSLKKSEYEALLRSYKKKECLKEYRRKYGHCPQINLWTTDILGDVSPIVRSPPSAPAPAMPAARS